MKNPHDSRFPIVFLPASVPDVMRLVPIAAERLGWMMAEAETREDGGRCRKLEFRAAYHDQEVLGCITVEERTLAGTGIRLRLADGDADSPCRAAFFQALLLLFRGARRAGDAGLHDLPPVLLGALRAQPFEGKGLYS